MMASIAALAALGAAAIWSISSLVSAAPARALGGPAFNRVRIALVFVALAIGVTLFGGWHELASAHATALVLSGIFGIFVGDTALFMTLARLGPRRTQMLYCLSAPMTVVLAWIFLDETLSLIRLVGIALVLAGVVLAIVFGKRRAVLHQWETIKGPLWIGVAVGLVAAGGQAVGLILSRPVMLAGVDPFAASAIRAGAAAACAWMLVLTPLSWVKAETRMTPSLLGRVALSGVLGVGMGMVLVMFALAHGEAAIVSTLSATTPVLILPLIWLTTREAPHGAAWAGAGLAVLGCGLILGLDRYLF